LHRINPVLIYKNIDKRVTTDSLTVGLSDAITRLENMGIEVPDDQKSIVEKIQGRRNKIEHHRFDHKEAEDANIIAEALKFIFFFVEFVLHARIENHIDNELLESMRYRVWDYNERQGIAEARFEQWAMKQWPKWDKMVEDIPEELEGTSDCPVCRQSWLVMGYHPKPFCFYCNMPIDAAMCENCGRTYLVKDGCCSFEEETDDPR
jgi:hypothetical protein